jgi:hypothetical protein
MKIASIEEFEVRSVNDFVNLKKTKLFKGYRDQGKKVGLAFIFARGAQSFALKDLDISWTDDEIDNFLEDNKLNDYVHGIFEKKKDLTLRQAKLVACASFIRNNFFKTYPGLLDRVQKNRAFAKEHGYIRSVFGSLRRVPQLFLSGKDDQKEYGEEFANLNNIATNSDIQNFESGSINRPIAIIHEWLIENKMKSRIIDQVHDAVDFYVHRDELDVMYNKIKEEFERRYPEQWEIPLEIEEKICDHKLGGFYKSGVSYDKYKKLVAKK